MKLILWDWNGTLLNDVLVNLDVFNKVGRECGCKPLSLEQYRQLYRHPIRGLYEDAGFDLERYPFESIARRWAEAYHAYEQPPTLHEHAVPVLERLRERGSRQTILSALPHEMLEKAVREHDLAHFFETVHGALDALGHGKVDMGREVVARFCVEGGDVTVIGDSSHDAEVAQELGAACLLVSHGSESEDRLRATGFPVCGSLRDVYAQMCGEDLPLPTTTTAS